MVKERVLNIAIIAGEPSGDLLGAGLIKALKERHPNIEFIGIGGSQMIAQGFKSIIPMESISVMGITAVLKHYLKLWLLQKKLIRSFLKNPPDIFIGIDAPDFNLTIEKKLKEAGIKTVHYVSPKVWAWRQNRVYKIKKSVDLMLTLFPFEKDFYKYHGVNSKFIGHPLADSIALQNDTLKYKKELGYQQDDKLIAVLPGSRQCELKYMGPLFIEVMHRLSIQYPNIKFIVPLPNESLKNTFQKQVTVKNYLLNLRVIVGQSQKVIAASDIVLVKAGTSTLETMLLKKPMVVAFKCSALTAFILKKMVKVKFAALPNLLANKELVKEFIQNDASVDSIVNEINLLLNKKNDSLKSEFDDIHKSLRKNASKTAAVSILHLLSN